MIENDQYIKFSNWLELSGSQPLNQDTVQHWIRYTVENQIMSLKYIHKIDKETHSFWLGTVKSNHYDISINSGNPLSLVDDAGSLCFSNKVAGYEINIFDDSGSLNIGKDSSKRLETIRVLGIMLQGVIHSVGQGMCEF